MWRSIFYSKLTVEQLSKQDLSSPSLQELIRAFQSLPFLSYPRINSPTHTLHNLEKMAESQK